jgi:hypothetical protein
MGHSTPAGLLSSGKHSLSKQEVTPPRLSLHGTKVNALPPTGIASALSMYGRGWTEVMNTPLVLPPLEVEIYGAKPDILSL